MGGSDAVADTGGGLNNALFLFPHYVTLKTSHISTDMWHKGESN